MKVFENQTEHLKVGQRVEDFPVSNNLSLSDLRGSPILLVFWKTL
jgi:peroxiredoxin